MQSQTLPTSVSSLSLGASPKEVFATRTTTLTRQRKALVSILFDDCEPSTENRVLILHRDASDDLASESLAGELATLILVAIAGVEVGLQIVYADELLLHARKLPELTCLRK